MTEAMPFLQKYDITFLRPPTISRGVFSMGKQRSSQTVFKTLGERYITLYSFYTPMRAGLGGLG